MGLRLTRGFSIYELQHIAGKNFIRYTHTIEKLRKQGYIHADTEQIRLTQRGRRILNTILLEFF